MSSDPQNTSMGTPSNKEKPIQVLGKSATRPSKFTHPLPFIDNKTDPHVVPSGTRNSKKTQFAQTGNITNMEADRVTGNQTQSLHDHNGAEDIASMVRVVVGNNQYFAGQHPAGFSYIHLA